MKLLTDKIVDWLRVKSYSDFGEMPFARKALRDFGDGSYYYYDWSGDVLYPKKDALLDEWQVSRLDVCVDTIFNTQESRAFYKTVSDAVKFVKIKEKRESFSKTLYFGSRENGLLLRVYEKGRASGFVDDYYTRWVRFEFELHGRKLKEYLYNFDTWEDVRNQLVANYIPSLLKVIKGKPAVDMDKIEWPKSTKRLDNIASEVINKNQVHDLIEIFLKKGALGVDSLETLVYNDRCRLEKNKKKVN